MLEKDYPYISGETRETHSCKYDKDKVEYYVADPSYAIIRESVEEAMEKVK